MVLVGGCSIKQTAFSSSSRTFKGSDRPLHLPCRHRRASGSIDGRFGTATSPKTIDFSTCRISSGGRPRAFWRSVACLNSVQALTGPGYRYDGSGSTSRHCGTNRCLDTSVVGSLCRVSMHKLRRERRFLRTTTGELDDEQRWGFGVELGYMMVCVVACRRDSLRAQSTSLKMRQPEFEDGGLLATCLGWRRGPHITIANAPCFRGAIHWAIIHPPTLSQPRSAEPFVCKAKGPDV
ncbi:hypothetical protein C8F01DRAFT_692416 [Mycena amicta]|nr:hypothetical protein C8F01DRAFT_692416 [Mycena amicta]